MAASKPSIVGGPVGLDYAVDIPNYNSEEWDNVDYFASHEEAIHFAQERFGADENGRICLVSKLPED